MHRKNIIHNLILKFSYYEWNQNFLSHPNLFVLIQPLKLLWFGMLKCIEAQFSNERWDINISIITIINYHTIYLIINIKPSMKDFPPLFPYIIFTNLNAERSPHNSGFFFPSFYQSFSITSFICNKLIPPANYIINGFNHNWFNINYNNETQTPFSFSNPSKPLDHSFPKTIGFWV